MLNILTKFRIKTKKIDLSNVTSLIALAALCIILTVMAPESFLTGNNLSNVMAQATVNAIISIGMTIVILTAGIDLSVGSIVAVAGVVMALCVKSGMPTIVAVILGVAVGALCGLLNGIMVTAGKLPPFIATLGMQMSLRGVALLLTGGMAISSLGESFTAIGVGTIPGIRLPVQVIFMIILYLITYYFLNYRQAGRFIYSIGGNEEATRLSGINVKKYKCMAYIISGVTAALAAYVLSAKLNSATPTAGMNYELDAVAATVIGGTSLEGGVGKISGTLIGAVIIAVLRNGLNIMNVSSYIQQVIIGLVIVGAVLIDTARKRD